FHRLMCHCDHVYLNSNEHPRALIEVESREARFVADTMRRYPLHDYQRLARLMHQLRVVKSDREIELIRKACALSEQGFRRVLRVLRQSIKGLVRGKKAKDWQKEGEQMIEKELVDLGLLTLRQIRKQDPDHPAFKKYFMHGLGHPLGLDVHDVGITIQPIQAGWVMTVEPGIYLREEGFAVRL